MAKSDLEPRTAWMGARDGGAEVRQSNLSEALRDYGIYIVLAVLVVGFSIVAPGIRQLHQFHCLTLLQVSVMGICRSECFSSSFHGAVDSAVGSILAIAGIFGVDRQDKILRLQMWRWRSRLPILIGVFCGAFNGSLIAWFRLPPLIVTLGYDVRVPRHHRLVSR